MPRATASAHGKTFTAALFLLALGAFFRGASLQSSAVPKPVTMGEELIVVGYERSTAIEALRASKPGAEMLELRAGDAPVAFSLPSTWTMREVRGTTIGAIGRSEDGPGYLRWSVPSRSRVSFITDRPESLLIRAQGSGSVLLKFVDIRLDTEEKQEQSILLQTEAAKLW